MRVLSTGGTRRLQQELREVFMVAWISVIDMEVRTAWILRDTTYAAKQPEPYLAERGKPYKQTHLFGSFYFIFN